MKKRTPAKHPWPELPFIVDGDTKRDNGSRRHFWAVRSSGDAYADSRLGADYAIALMRYEAEQLRKDDYHPKLPSIVACMPRKISHAEISFLAMIGWAAAGGLQYAEELNEHFKRDAAKRAA